MKFGPTRGNPILIFEHFFRDFGLVLLCIIITLLKGPEIIMDNIVVLAIVIITPINTLMKYFFTTYSIDDEMMTIASGFFVKKTMEIPLKAITTVDLSQNLLFQLFKIYKIKADNSSQTNDTAQKAEVVMALKKESALYVKSLLEAKGSESEKIDHQEVEEFRPQESITCSILDFFLLGLLQSKAVYIISLVPFVFGGGGYVYSLFVDQSDANDMMEKLIDGFEPAAIIAIAILCSYVIGVVSSEVLTMIKYFNYTVTNQSKSLFVEYGLITKKSYTLMKEKISGVTLKQTVLMRIFGYCTIEVFIIGYGDSSEDNKQELSILYPIAKLSEVDGLLEKMLPEMKFDREYHQPNKEALRFFFYNFRMAVTIALFIGAAVLLAVEKTITQDVYIMGGGLLILVIMILTVFLEFYNSGIYANEQVVSISTGIFTRQMIFIKTSKIESVSEKSNLLKRKRGYTSIQLGFIAPLRVANVKAKNMTFQEYEEVQNVLSY